MAELIDAFILAVDANRESYFRVKKIVESSDNIALIGARLREEFLGLHVYITDKSVLGIWREIMGEAVDWEEVAEHYQAEFREQNEHR
jgi:hypothetical protein